MTRDVLDRINSLIRRRNYVAEEDAAGGGTDKEKLPAAANDEDDVPVLTEVVPAGGTVAPDALLPHEALAVELAGLVEQRLAAELPVLLDNAFAHLTDELREGIGRITEAAVRDFLARRQDLRASASPLDVPEG